jgi:hypothetical protein
MPHAPLVTILPYFDTILQTIPSSATGCSAGCLYNLLVHLLLSVEMSRIVGANNLDFHTFILISQPLGLGDKDAYTLLTALLLSTVA